MENTQTDNKLILPTSQIQKQEFKAKIKNDIMEGSLPPLEFYRRAKLIDECIEELKKDQDIFDYAVSERAKWGKEKPVVNGSVVDTGSRTTYDYESCNDSVYNELKEKIKAREAYLKALPPQGAVDPDTGELVLPPVKRVSEFITVKI